MKHPEEPWEQDPLYDGCPPDRRPPFAEDEEPEEESREFAAIRKIELLGRLHHMAFRSLFRDDGLPPAQAGAMKVIIRHPGLSQRELADKLHIQRATATVMLQKMEKSGYIDRRPDQEDQRISRIYPTESALVIDAENQKNVNASFARCISGIPETDFDTMLSSMIQMEENLRSILKEHPESPARSDAH